MKSEILRMEKVIVKKDNLTLLDNLNLQIFQSEIMGLVSLNTTGKDTLIDIIQHNKHIHYGRVYFNEQLVNNYQHSPLDQNRVDVIESKNTLIEDLTVIDNIFVISKNPGNIFVSTKSLNSKLNFYTEELGVKLNGYNLVSDLSIYEKFIVKLIRSIVKGASLIVIKDISSKISSLELLKFHRHIKYYSSKGVSFLYICNHHEEAFKVSDRMLLMKDGSIIKIFGKNQFLNENMLPYYYQEYSNIERVKKQTSKNILSYNDVSISKVKHLNLDILKGGCTAIWDRDNTLKNDLMKLMSKNENQFLGEIILEGTKIDNEKFQDLILKNVVIINENPTETMLFKEMTYLQNLYFLIDQRKRLTRLKNSMVKSIINEYKPILGEEIFETNLEKLSLKSRYNLVYYRVQLYNPKIVFLIEPFSGADMYLRLHIIELINTLIKEDITVVILAVSIADSLIVADRLLTFEKGQKDKEYHWSEFEKLSGEATSFI